MIRIYLASNDKLPTPLTIFASDYNEADLILMAWVERHWPQAIAAPTEFKLLSATELALQPQLAEAAGAGVSGVGYWTGHRAGWVVAAPHEDRLGALTPMETDVRCYSVFDEDGEQLVFAQNMEQAVASYTVWSMLAYGAMDEFFSVKEMSRWLLRGPQVMLREGMDAGLLGVGSACKDGFWRIYPADYEHVVRR